MTNAITANSTDARTTLRLVLFDLDDTLCDYAAARALRLRIAFETALATRPGADPDIDEMIGASLDIHPHGTDHFPELLARYGVNDPAAAHAAAHWYRTNRFHGLALFPDALATLHLARTAAPNRRVGIITNGPAEVQRAKLELLEVEAHVDFVIVSGEFGIEKPEPEIFAEALRLGGATAAESLFIGDSAEFDIAGARRSGIRSVWLNRTGLPWPQDDFHPDHEVTHLTAVHRLLQG